MTKHDALASLYVLLWGKYRRSQHVQSPTDREHEYKRLLAKKRQWAKDGRMPIPADDVEPSLQHVLAVMVADLAGFQPTPQEAYLFIEICGRCVEFEAWGYLASHSNKPASWFSGGAECQGKTECARLLKHVAGSFEPVASG